MSTPFGLAFDSTGALYAANQGNTTISKIDNAGNATLFATTAQAPVGLAFDAAGGLLVAENGQTIQKFTGNVGAIFNSTIQPQFIAVRCEPATISIAVYAGLTIQGSIGCQHRIDYTTFLNSDPSLTVWTPLTTLTLASSPFLFVDTTVVSGSASIAPSPCRDAARTNSKIWLFQKPIANQFNPPQPQPKAHPYENNQFAPQIRPVPAVCHRDGRHRPRRNFRRQPRPQSD